MADGKKISELTESATIEDAHYFPVSDGTDTTKVAYSTIKNDLIDYSEELAEVISPTVTPTEIEGGVRLTITDIEGTKTANILNGSPNNKDYVRWFDTVADMQAAIDLQAGMTCHTNGFRASGDGGAAYYTIAASGTANGMDVLACQQSLKAVLVIESHVTPEMFGAYGDGTHDDTECLNRMFAVANCCVLGGSYVLHECIIDAAGLRIFGINGASINYGATRGIIIKETSHDVEISGLTFNGTFNVGSIDPSNYALGIYDTSSTAEYEAYNISVHDCVFNGRSVFGLVANNVLNLTVNRCLFKEFVYKPNDGAGGYAILTQSCRNVNISNCKFEPSDYNRHDIYVSVVQSKTENKASDTVSITDCVFDHSGMSILDGHTAFYSPNTVCVDVRACANFSMTNCVAYGATGLITCEDGDGFVGASLENCTIYDPMYLTSSDAPYESRSGFNFIFNSNNSIARCDFCNEVKSAVDGHLDLSILGGTLYLSNAKMSYRYVLNCDYITMHDIQISSNGNMQRTVSSVLLGKIYAIYGGSYFLFDTNYTKNIHPSVFSSELMGAFTFNGNGSLTNPNHPYVRITDSFENGVHTITMPNISQRPTHVQADQYATVNNFVYANVFGSGFDVNQFQLSKYNTSGQLINASSGNGIKFTVVG